MMRRTRLRSALTSRFVVLLDERAKAVNSPRSGVLGEDDGAPVWGDDDAWYDDGWYTESHPDDVDDDDATNQMPWVAPLAIAVGCIALTLVIVALVASSRSDGTIVAGTDPEASSTTVQFPTNGADDLAARSAPKGPSRPTTAGISEGPAPVIDMASIGAIAPLTPSLTSVDEQPAVGWVEPDLGAESSWVDGGNGVALPDLLLRIRFCESTNNYAAANSGSSARGAYQFLTKSWEWYGHAERFGVSAANLATPAQQDQAALATLRQDGARPWAESRPCWGNPEINPGYATAKPPVRPTTTQPTTSTTTGGSTTSTTDPTGSTTADPTSTTESTTSTTAESTTTASTTTSSTTTSTTAT